MKVGVGKIEVRAELRKGGRQRENTCTGTGAPGRQAGREASREGGR